MKEFYLVPVHEMDELRNKTPDVKDSSNPYADENKLFNNENLNKETILGIKQQMDRLRSEIHDKISNKKKEEIPIVKNENQKHLSYMKTIIGNVPSGSEVEAMKTIDDMEKNGVIVTVNGKYARLNDGSGDEVSLRDLIRAIYIRNAKVSHIKVFLSKIINHISKDIIRNEKLIELDILSKNSKKEEEVFPDGDTTIGDGEDVFYDNVLDVSGGSNIKTKFVPWMVYR